MLNKLKRKFILLATVSMFVLMATVVCIMNVINFSVIEKECDSTADVLIHSNLSIFGKDNRQDKNPPDNGNKPTPPNMSPEVPYESRYFAVTLSSDGTVIKSDFTKILSVDDDSAEYYIEQAVASENSRGFIKQFRYIKQENGQDTTILFLDCGRKLDSFKSFLLTSTGVGFGGCVIAFLAFVLFSGKIIKPIAESYDKQKRFISDAGHEMKTPLTIINANLDLLESDQKSEELEDIRFQTKRMTELTNNLVLLSKMEESRYTVKKIDMPFSDTVEESANTFRAIAAAKNIDYTVNIVKGVSLCGVPDEIRRLVCVLLDNAMKYTQSGGVVTLDLSANKKTAVLSVFNTTKEQIKKEDMKRVFDRFFRTDESRNSATGGQGIGLSVAKAIVEAHDGDIKASTETGNDFCITATFPLK